MSKRAKNINLFLMDGDANGRIKCTLANWTGIAYKIPRTELEKCKNRSDLKQSGIYFLFGISEDTGKNLVYIGQAGLRKNGEGLLCRLMEHKRNPDKDYWTEAITFTTSNNSFGPTEISYLENRFTNLAKEADRYTVQNNVEPTLGNVTEEKESELEEFIDYAKVIMGTLGHKVFVPLIKVNEPVNDTTDFEELHLFFKRKSRKSNQMITAECKQTQEGFVVLKGSQIEVLDSESIPEAIKQRRAQALIDDDHILLKDELFNSPSYAAAFVIGGSINGLTAWRNADNKTLKELEQDNL